MENFKKNTEQTEINRTNRKVPFSIYFRLFRIFFLGIVMLASSCSSSDTHQFAVIETDFGNIKIKFYPDVAPKHVRNFKDLARDKFYDGLGFHRVIPDNIIQGGDPTTREGDSGQWGMGIPGQPTVEAEFNSKPFVSGTVGMARRGNDSNSATSQFFICLREHPEWNGRYTVFGEVVEGLDVVEKISRVPSDQMTQKVREKVAMKRVYLQ